MEVKEKITVLAFDETYLSQKIFYNKRNEQFIRSHKCVEIDRGTMN